MSNPYRIAAEQPYYPPEQVMLLPSNYAGYSSVALHALSEYWCSFFRDMERHEMKKDCLSP